MIGKTPSGHLSLRIPHDPADCTSGHHHDIRGGFWGAVDRMLEVPFSYILRDLAGCFLLMAVSLSVYLAGGGGHGDESADEENPGLKYIDPSVALVTIFFMIVSSRTIARESCLILLQTIPAHLDVAELRKELFERFPTSILNVHEVHIWCLVPGNVVVTLHVIFQSKEVSKTLESYVMS